MGSVLEFCIEEAITLGSMVIQTPKIKVFYDKLFNSKDGVSAHEFLKICDLMTYDSCSKQNDIKLIKLLDFEGVYILYNKSKNQHFIGKSKTVFRKIERHFKGYENKDVYNDWHKGNTFYIKAIKLKNSKHNDLTSLEKEVRKNYKHDYTNSEQKKVVSKKQPKQKTAAMIEAEEKYKEKLRRELVRRTEKERINKLRKKRLKAFIFKHKRIKTGISSDELIGINYKEAVECFFDEGFTNVCPIALKDLYIEDLKRVGEVERITIDGVPLFDDDYLVPYDSEIIVLYHEKREFAFPYNSKNINKLNYKICVDNLKEIGFTNVSVEGIADLVTGWIKKDGTVREITVENCNKLTKGQGIKYDAKIVVKYHTFSNK